MYLWETANFDVIAGGHRGDWGQRMSDNYILDTANATEASITEHEIGHGFGMTYFYDEDERPPGGFPVGTIMWGSRNITELDGWMLRYIWSQLKQDTNRFPPK